MHRNLFQSLEAIAGNSEKSAAAAARLGGRVVIVTKLINAMLPHLSASQRLEVDRSFRLGVEDIMSWTDDKIIPAEFHAALLEQTNVFLAALQS